MKILLLFHFTHVVVCSHMLVMDDPTPWLGLDREIPPWFLMLRLKPIDLHFWSRVEKRLEICEKQETELKEMHIENNKLKEDILANDAIIKKTKEGNDAYIQIKENFIGEKEHENSEIRKELNQIKQELFFKSQTIDFLELELKSKNLELEKLNRNFSQALFANSETQRIEYKIFRNAKPKIKKHCRAARTRIDIQKGYS